MRVWDTVFMLEHLREVGRQLSWHADRNDRFCCRGLHQPAERERDAAELKQPWGKQTCTTDNQELSLLHLMQDRCLIVLRFLYRLDERRMWLNRPLMKPDDERGLTFNDAFDVLYRLRDVLIARNNAPSNIAMMWAHTKVAALQRYVHRLTMSNQADYDGTIVPTYAALSDRLGGITGIHRSLDLGINLRSTHNPSMLTARHALGVFMVGLRDRMSLMSSYYWGMMALGIGATRNAKRGSALLPELIETAKDDTFKAFDLSGRKATSMARLILDMAGMNTTYCEQDREIDELETYGFINEMPIGLFCMGRGLMNTTFAVAESARLTLRVAAVVPMEDVAPVSHKRKIERLD
jgi:hypothetical protein